MNKFQRKLKKLFTNPKLFFSDMTLKRKKVESILSTTIDTSKKYQGKHKFIIVCPTYNVEKYVNDFFISIRNQSLDFKKHIHILFVDDGSTDSSAQIIREIQNEYPSNVTYLYKDNGGLSSCRNFGLDYIYENNLDYDYLTFTDPDDFLNQEYFMELDKLLSNNPNCQIVSCNLIYFFEDKNIFKDIHPLKYRYTKTHIRKFSDLDNDVLLSAATAVYKLSLINDINIRFDEEVKPSFEDCKFNNQLLTIFANTDYSVAFLKEAKYFYRQREDKSSLMNGSWQNKGLFNAVLEKGVLDMLKFSTETLGYVPKHIQMVALFHCIGYYRRLMNNKNIVNQLLSNNEVLKFKLLLTEIFSYIDGQELFKCSFSNLDKKIKVGLLGMYKNEHSPISYINVTKIDIANKKIILSLFTSFRDDVIEIKLDGKIIKIDEEKFVVNEFLGDIFYFDRIFTIKYSDIHQNMQIYVNGKKANITVFTKGYTGGTTIVECIQNMNSKIIYPNLANSWILMDRVNKADDNAEHFYRYLMRNHPEQKIYFAISKDSPDWSRLENDGFNLLDYESKKFIKELTRCKYIVSSHLLIWNVLIKKHGKQAITAKRKIWLQHGVISNDHSNLLNTKEIDLMITSTEPEYNSITAPFTKYQLLPSQVILSGLPRHDMLLAKNRELPTEKVILVMPTWRTWLKDDIFENSDYFMEWNKFLSSNELSKLLRENGYKLIFSPHEEIQVYKNLFYTNEYIKIYHGNDSMQNLFAQAELMITDYSSVAYEMGFLNKIVIYYQFDTIEFFNKHYQKGFFDLEKDGFGACTKNLDGLLNELKLYFLDKNAYHKKYKSKMDIFSNHSGNSCEQIFNRIKELN